MRRTCPGALTFDRFRGERATLAHDLPTHAQGPQPLAARMCENEPSPAAADTSCKPEAAAGGFQDTKTSRRRRLQERGRENEPG